MQIIIGGLHKAQGHNPKGPKSQSLYNMKAILRYLNLPQKGLLRYPKCALNQP